MSDELEPIEEDEFVLRRIHRDHYKTSLPDPVLRMAFEPRRGENDGLSVYRERWVTPAQVAASGRTPGAYYVTRLAVRDLRKLNLTVVPAPRSELPGHAVIPELSWEAQQKDKKRSKQLQIELAKLAGQFIAHRPEH